MGPRNQILIFFVFFSIPAFSQTSLHFIYFTDKNNNAYSIHAPEEFLSEKSIERRKAQNIPIRERDLPVTSSYLDSLKKSGVVVKYSSKWFNAALIEATDAQLNQILDWAFIANELKVARKAVVTHGKHAEDNNYGGSDTQIKMLGIHEMHKKGYSGEGKVIAVIDAGFANLPDIPAFDSLRISGRILSTYDFADQETDVYDDHEHGTNVLSVMAAYKEGQIIGASWKAGYHLLRTEIVENYEKLAEEVYWVIAAEYADSAGADIINSSLGYSTFDDEATSHTYADLDGKTSIITQAAEYAYSTGMIVVNSAGNDGEAPWKYISVPADGPNVLTVGGVDKNENRVNFSSIGPTADGRTKPDAVALASGVMILNKHGALVPGTGTSYAAPMVSGFAANLWQQFPDFTNEQIINLIKQSASHYPHADNNRGYGVPHFFRALAVMGTVDAVPVSDFSLYPNPVQDILYFSFAEINFTPVSISIYDITGRELQKHQTDLKAETVSINLSTLTPGIYKVSIHSADGGIIHKTIVRR